MNYPYPYLTVSLLDGCNKACRHCYRTAIPSDHGFELNREEAVICVHDAASLAIACLFGGGEPTAWQGDNMDFLSLLMRAAKQNGRAAFLSNGFVFEDKRYSDEFVHRYVKECGLPLLMLFTVDFLHENYDSERKRIPFLDSVLAARDRHVTDQNMRLFLISHWTNDRKLNIPVDVFEAYARQGVRYQIDDFMMWGRAADLDDLSCYLRVGSSDKTHLGPYRQILAEKMTTTGRIQNEAELGTLSNRELLSKLSVCGQLPNHFISWGRKYYYCIPQMGYDWFAVSELGRLDTSAMEAFYDERPIIREIQGLSIFGVLEKHKEYVGNALREDIESMRENIRFAGCSVCLRLSREGILREINQRLLDAK